MKMFNFATSIGLVLKTNVGQHITAVSVRAPIELMDEQADVYLAGQIPGE
jgi:hypothetical protein